MIKVTVTILTLIAGVMASECDEPAHVVCRDDSYSFERFPETKVEFNELCTYSINLFKCIIKHEEKCEGIGYADDVIRYLRAFNEICDENTLLHAAIIDNLKCYSEIEKEGRRHECYMLLSSGSPNTLHKYAEALSDEGVLSLSDDEHQINNTLKCIFDMQLLACYAIRVEDKCGKLAMDAVLEFVEKISDVSECERAYVYLPTIIRIYRLEEQQAGEVADVFKRKK